MRSLSITLGQLVVQSPARSRFFEAWQLDYCCGGGRTLSDACTDRSLDPTVIAAELCAFDERIQQNDDRSRDWRAASLTELCDHIERTHHAYLRSELPRLTGLLQKVANAHGERFPQSADLAAVFLAFRSELESHMVKEEQILFPLCRLLETRSATDLPGVAGPIRQMVQEHDDAGGALTEMRCLTDDFTAPEAACATWRSLYTALAELEADMHQHIHLENNLLFPAALTLSEGR